MYHQLTTIITTAKPYTKFHFNMKCKSIYILTTKEFSIGLLYKERKLKTIEKLKHHKANYTTWLNEDKLNHSLFKSISLYNMTSFLSSNFECNCNKTNQYIISIDTNWSIMNMKHKHNNSRSSYTSNGSININTTSTNNLILRNKIIKLSNNNINLRTFALKCTFRLLLSGECYFFIFSRTKNENDFNENTLVCFISKEIESSRIFVNYAVFEQPIDNNNNNNKLYLHIIKKQEIPNQKHYNNCIDVTDVYFNFIDNGNDNCIMFFPYQKSYHQNFIADFYYPQYDLCNLYIAVSGDLISLKELNITSTETKISLNDIKYNYKQHQPQLNKSVCCLCF